MQPILPELPDELWWSGWARQVELVAPAGPVTRHMLVAGNRRSLGSPLFPRQIAHICARSSFLPSVDEVISGQTLLPLFVPFSSSNKIRNAERSMKANGHAEFELGVAAMRDYPQHLKACMRCVRQDRIAYGIAYWHRCHQAPGVLVCAEHQCALHSTHASARATSQIANLTTIDGTIIGPALSVPKEHRDDALWLARSVKALLDKPIGRIGDGRLATAYRAELKRLGLIDAFGRARHGQLTQSFKERFARLLPLLRCPSLPAAQRDHWLARLLSRERWNQSPLHHLLMIRFLALDAQPFLALASRYEVSTKATFRRMPACYRSARVTDKIAQEKRKRWLNLQQRSRGSMRDQNDALYCWLRRNDNAWLRDNSNAR